MSAADLHTCTAYTHTQKYRCTTQAEMGEKSILWNVFQYIPYLTLQIEISVATGCSFDFLGLSGFCGMLLIYPFYSPLFHPGILSNRSKREDGTGVLGWLQRLSKHSSLIVFFPVPAHCTPSPVPAHCTGSPVLAHCAGSCARSPRRTAYMETADLCGFFYFIPSRLKLLSYICSAVRTDNWEAVQNICFIFSWKSLKMQRTLHLDFF